ncbi:MAG: tyrosine-type recombinase/integrase [Gemmataceae bacterium]
MMLNGMIRIRQGKGDKFQAWGTHLKDAYIRSMLPRLGKKAGIEKRIHAHGFRHSLATELAKKKQNLGAISAQLGHSSVAVTIGISRRLHQQNWLR